MKKIKEYFLESLTSREHIKNNLHSITKEFIDDYISNNKKEPTSYFDTLIKESDIFIIFLELSNTEIQVHKVLLHELYKFDDIENDYKVKEQNIDYTITLERKRNENN